AALHEPHRCVPWTDGRSLSVDGRAAIGQARLPIPGCATRIESLVTAREVAAGDSALHRAVLPRHRGVPLRNLRVVCDPLYRALSARTFRLRGRSPAVGQSRDGVRVLPRDVRVSAGLALLL